MKIMVDLDKTVFNCPSLAYTLEELTFSETNKKLKYSIVDKEGSKEYKNLLFFLKLSHAKNLIPTDNVVDVLKKWNEQGIEIEFVSSRANFKSFQKAIVKWLESHGINFGKIIIGCNNKAEYGKLTNCDIIIDDNLQNCISCEKLGIEPIWFRTQYNQNEKKAKKNIIQAHNWSQVDNIIQSLISEELPEC